MGASTDLEGRLRSGLSGAAETIPAAAPEPSTAMATGPRLRELTPGRRRRLPKLVPGIFAAAATVAVVAAAVVAFDDDDRAQDLELVPRQEPESVTESVTETTEITEPVEAAHVPTPANGMVPGQAVIQGSVIHLYGPDGQETDTVDLGQSRSVQDGASDLAGGWVVCGDNLTWIKADGQQAQVPLDPTDLGFCWADAVEVVDSPEGPTVVTYGAIDGYFTTVVLATGARTQLPLPLEPSQSYAWSATAGRILVAGFEEMFAMYDIATGEPFPIAPIDAEDFVVDMALSQDGSTVAVLGSHADGPSEVRVYDLTTGAIVFQEEVDVSLEGSEMSYDGTTLAFGNWYEGPVTVVDLASGARHTIDAHGVVL